jgi:hypothetical protein
MKTKQWGLLVGFCCLVTIFFWSDKAHAIFYLDADKTFEISGQIQTRLTFRLNDSKGFTNYELGNVSTRVPAGHLIQHRNLAYLEVNHDLKKINFPLDFKVKYHVVGRLFYEGIYDYGPHVFREVGDTRNPVKDIDRFKWDADVREYYVDISRGPLFFRIGRQNLSWGETDVFRLLDNINPLDNTFGFIFEDLNDRRIPLRMIRGSYNLGRVGPISSFGVEGFFVPGAFEHTVAPITPPGTPYAIPSPLPGGVPIPGTIFEENPEKPGRRWDNSRFGLRLQGVLFDNINLSLAGYRTFLDDPTPRMVVYRQFQPPVIPPILAIELNRSENKVWIFGGSLNMHEKHIDTVIRSEVAYFNDVPVFIPRINIPDPDMSLGFPQFLTGEIPKRDEIRFSVGLDKDVWIRALNKKNTFLVSLQYFGQYIRRYDQDISAAVPRFPNSTDFVSIKRYEQTITLLMRTTYMNGNLTPQFVAAYDPRGAVLLMPSIQYQWDPFRINLQYATIQGKFTGMGFFRDRDQVSLSLSWLF